MRRPLTSFAVLALTREKVEVDADVARRLAQRVQATDMAAAMARTAAVGARAGTASSLVALDNILNQLFE